jgi:hypothetical protein
VIAMMDAELILNSQMVKGLQSIRDYRSKRGRRYPLWVMLLVIILGVMSGAQGYKALEDFGIRHYQSLCQFLGITLKRLPSDTTLRRLFEGINLVELTLWFNHWAQSQYSPVPGEVLAVDGKSLSSTLSNHKESVQNFISVVSAYSHQHRLVLAHDNYQNKLESEIVVVQRLLESLNVRHVTFTFDALHCQKNTAVGC